MTQMIRPVAGGRKDAVRHQRGFTLIEMSIVLTIIGLIVGGILKGQELINNARIKSLVAQIDNIKSATLTFQDRYGYLPGDYNSATSFGFAAAATNGDGLGTIGPAAGGPFTTSNVAMNGSEAVMVWPELTAANLLSGYYTPQNAVFLNTTTATVTQWLPGKLTGTFLWLGTFEDATYPQTPTLAVRLQKEDVSTTASTGLSVADLSGLDAKYDDGFPFQGSITVINASQPNCASAAATTANYLAASAAASCSALFAVQ